MFWACLGEEPWANADYWIERNLHEGPISSFSWRVDVNSSPMV